MAVSQYEFRTVNLKRLLLLLGVVLGVCSAAYAVHRMQVHNNAETMLRVAQNTRQVGNLDESLVLYERYLNFRPRDTAVLAEYAEAIDQAAAKEPKRLREFFEVYERVLTADPGRADDRRKLITRYIEIGAYARAAGHLAALMKADPALVNNGPVMEQSALCAEKLGKTDEAIDRYRAAIESGGASSSAYLRLANILQATPTKLALDESRKLLERLVKDRPTDAAARLARARFFLASNQPAEAIRELEIAVNDCPGAADSQELIFLLADQHRRAGNLPAARDALQRAVRLKPDDAKYRVVLADLHAALGDTAAARDELRQALRLPDLEELVAVEVLDRMLGHAELLPLVHESLTRRYGDAPGGYADYLAGKLALAAGDWPEAQAKLERALPALEKSRRHLARAHEALGHCARAANNPDRMAACYQKALSIDESLDSARLSLADALSRVGRSAEAAQTFRRFAATSPAARVRLAQLALAEQLAKPDDRRNWAEFDEVIGNGPRPPELEHLRAIALRARDRAEEAMTAAKEQVEQHPREPGGYLTLAALQSETDPQAAIRTLRNAAEVLGDRVEFRLAQAFLLARQPMPDQSALAELEDNAGIFSQDDRYSLYMGLANLHARRLANTAEAARLFGLAADTKPADLLSRAARLDALLADKRFDEAEQAIADIRRLDGDSGPYLLFARTARELVRDAPLAANRLAELRRGIGPLLEARPTWGRAALLAAELSDAAGDAEAALDLFRRAFALGERRPAAVQRLVTLLVGRRRMEEARRVLAEAERTGELSDDLRRQASMLESMLDTPGERTAEFVRRTESSDKSADHVFRGQWLLLANRNTEAVAAMEKAIALDVNNADAWLGLLAATHAGGDAAAAEAAWSRAEAAIRAMPHRDPAMAACLLGVGREALQDYAGAERYYRDGLTAYPNHPLLLHQSAVLCQRLGRMGDSIVHYRTLLNSAAADSLKAKARRELALAAMLGPNPFARVHPALAMLAANTPLSPDDLRARGLILGYDPFRRAEARGLLEQSAALAMPNQDDAMRLAEFHARDSDDARAEEVLREATRGSPRLPPFMLAFLHQLQRKTGREADAAETLDRLVAIAPESWDAAVEQARVLAGAREPEEAARRLIDHPFVAQPAAKLSVLLPVLQALDLMDHAERLARDLAAAANLPGRHMGLISVLAARGRYLDAAREALLLPDAEYPPAVKARALFMVILPQPRVAVPASDVAIWDQMIEGATRWVETALAAQPNDAMLHTLNGVIADARGRTDAAIASFEKAAAADARAETAVNGLAYLLVAGPDPQPARAEQLITNLIAEVGPKPALLDTRAAARIAQGNIADAAADIEAAIVQLPRKGAYWFRRALMHEKLGEFDSRKLAFQKARQLGLSKANLHPLEWPAFDRLSSSLIQ